MIRTSKEQVKMTFTEFLNVCNKFINPILRVIKTTKESPATPLRSIGTDSSLLTGTSDLTVAETLNTNRYGRIVALPRRFRE